MDKNEKTPFYYSSRFWVIFYFSVYALFMCLQFVLGALGSEVAFDPENILKYINGEATLPIDVFSWGWTALVSMYCGFDRFVDIKTTMALKSGQISMGDLSKLRGIIIMSLSLLIISTVFSFITKSDYQLSSNAAAFAMSVIIYVSGNKIVKGLKFYDGKEDKNKDGIPDEVEEEFYRWKRAQIKQGTEERFITFDYFLDENENARRILKGEEPIEKNNNSCEHEYRRHR